MDFTVTDTETTVHYSGEQSYNKKTNVISTHLNVEVYENLKSPYQCEYTEELLHVRSKDMCKWIRLAGFSIQECCNKLADSEATFTEPASYVIYAVK